MYLNDYPIGILRSQLPKHDIYGKFYEPDLMNYFPLVLELRKVNQDIFESVPQQELALFVIFTGLGKSLPSLQIPSQGFVGWDLWDFVDFWDFWDFHLYV